MKAIKNHFLLHDTMSCGRGTAKKQKHTQRRRDAKGTQSFSLRILCAFASLRESFCFSSSVGRVVFISTFSILLLSQTFAQEKCETALTEAQSMYGAGRFAQAIVRLNLCVPDRIPPVQRIDAYRLLAICYLNEDYREEARTAIRKIFDINRQYEPNAVQDPQPYRDLADEVKATLPKPLTEKLFGGVKKWLWIGGGAAGTYFAVQAFGKKSVEPDLPVPPDLP